MTDVIDMAELELARRVVERHCELSAERTRILLNDPRRVLELALAALGDLPETAEAIDADLNASCRRIRADDTWWRDDRAQLRRIVLLRIAGHQGIC